MKIKRFIIIMIIITVVGVFVSWTYEKPDTKIYSNLNKIDVILETAQTAQNLSLTESLNQFHTSIKIIITQSETSTNQSAISFDEYNAQYATLHRINNELTNALEETTEQLAKSSSTSSEMIQVQKDRLIALQELNDEIGSTLTYLQNFEEMIYTKKISTVKAYLQDLDSHFNQIQVLNNNYSDISKTYFEQKAELYKKL